MNHDENPEEDRRREERRAGMGIRLRIVPEISVADIATVVGIGFPLLIWGARLDARVEQMERQITTLQAEDQRQASERDKLRLEVRDELREMRKDIASIAAQINIQNGLNARSRDERRSSDR